jgi:hypothetical protein
MSESIEQFRDAILSSQKTVRLELTTPGNRKFQILFRGRKAPERSILQVYEGKDWHFTSFSDVRWILLEDFDKLLERV